MRDRDSDYTDLRDGAVAVVAAAGLHADAGLAPADDVVQTAIMQLYTHWSRVSRVENPDGYARTVLVRSFLGERRRWGSRVRLMAETPDTAARMTDHAGQVAVRTALAEVPPRQRATLVLRFYCDMNVEQVAEVLRCSPGTVKSQTARGLEALRRLLADTSARAAERSRA